MNPTKPRCGHSNLNSDCALCENFRKHWYDKIAKTDPEWRDIEYGMENAERLYEPARACAMDPLTTDYYDRVLVVFHTWVTEGKSRRDCLIAELLGSQVGNTGTERGIVAVLKAKRLKPNSRFTVRQTIKEINAIVLKIAHPHMDIEQGVFALYPLDSKPLKDEADGQSEAATKRTSRAA